MNNNPTQDNLESQTLLNKLVIEYLRDQRRKRRFRWLVRGAIVLLLVYLYFSASSLSDDRTAKNKPHVGLVDIEGTISDTDTASADNFAKSLAAAYKSEGLRALLVRINSPGGSPVQADYMYNTLQYYRKKYPSVKTYAVCVDICASAAYYVAAGADEIYANPSSMVGSIGVLYNGFGFVDAIQKLGITRRLQTAGTNKAFLDPFSPTTPEQQQLLQVMLNEVHQQFIAKVKEGRGSRLKIDNDTFSGLFWTGTQSKERGLIDGFASSGELLRDVIKREEVIDYTYKQSVFDRMTKNIGAAVANQLPAALGLKEGIRE
ncbi:S49 family peptidase [Legionella erythra]|uniref:Signal peptide peptidase n=1 Tax=Legionella erythra TaxID=448 RepID=A0A0W0TJR8_LEGER|nr:S49 family peptidase [Legionella erythra]KTC95816.1 signal peptide peptidase [Legionella erythra]